MTTHNDRITDVLYGAQKVATALGIAVTFELDEARGKTPEETKELDAALRFLREAVADMERAL